LTKSADRGINCTNEQFNCAKEPNFYVLSWLALMPSTKSCPGSLGALRLGDSLQPRALALGGLGLRIMKSGKETVNFGKLSGLLGGPTTFGVVRVFRRSLRRPSPRSGPSPLRFSPISKHFKTYSSCFKPKTKTPIRAANPSLLQISKIFLKDSKTF
jgi:hypothetical protein